MIPTIATVAVGFSALLSNISATSNANRARNLAELGTDAGALVADLQSERAASTMVLTGTGTQENFTSRCSPSWEPCWELSLLTTS